MDLATFVGYAVYTWSLQFQIILNRVKEAADLLGWQANMCLYCLDSILLIMWWKVVWMYSGKVTCCLLAGSVSPHWWMDGWMAVYTCF